MYDAREYQKRYRASHRELIRTRNREFMRKKRALERSQPKSFHAPPIKKVLSVGADGGNDAYKELLKAERAWMKGYPFCGVCGQKHPPMKVVGVRPLLWMA